MPSVFLPLTILSLFFCHTSGATSSLSPREALVWSAKFSADAYDIADCGFSAKNVTLAKLEETKGEHSHFCVGIGSGALFVIIQGTENYEQWVKNLEPQEQRWEFGGYSAHILLGFRDEAGRIFKIIHPQLHMHQSKPIYFAGHSRGGGLAQILHAYADTDFPEAKLHSFSFGGPATMNDTSPRVRETMWSFRYDRDPVPILGLHSLQAFFCDPFIERNPCGSFPAIARASRILRDTKFAALATQADKIAVVLNRATVDSRAWHIGVHLGHLSHLTYWPATDGIPRDPMPYDGQALTDFMDDVYRPGDIGDFLRRPPLAAFRGFFSILEDHDYQLYYEFINKAVKIPVLTAELPWASRLASITNQSETETRPEWIPDLEGAAKEELPSKNWTKYDSPWWRCVEGWEEGKGTLECHLPDRACATRFSDQKEKRIYFGSTCWKLNFARLPVWAPNYSDPAYVDAWNKKVIREDHVECTVTKTPTLMDVKCSGRKVGNCVAKMRISEATGESWYLWTPRCKKGKGVPSNDPISTWLQRGARAIGWYLSAYDGVTGGWTAFAEKVTRLAKRMRRRAHDHHGLGL
jgi:hypothetical protein